MKSLLLVFAVIAATWAAKVDYTGHMVIRIVPETEEQVEYLHYLQSHSSLDFWYLSGKPNQATDLRVSPETYYDIARSLAERKMNHEIIISDVGQLIKEEEQAIALRRAVHSGKAFDFDRYHSYDEIKDYLTQLDESKIVNNKVLGTTEEGRDILEVTISGGKLDQPIIFFDCSIEARDWVAAATCLWIIDTLVSGSTTDPEIYGLLNSYDWVFIPLVNPDGYAHTWDNSGGERLWRKNRAVLAGSECIGVDINRNFPEGFGDDATSSGSPCAETYFGPKAFSEKESISVRTSLASYRSRIKAALSVHAYGQHWLSPFGFQSNIPAEYDEMERVMKVGVDAILNTYGTPYTYGRIEKILFKVPGTTIDHYYRNEAIVHSYALELRDQGTTGFLLPPNQIRPTATETWNGIKAFVKALKQ